MEAHIAPALRNLRALIQNVTNAQIDEDAKYDLLFRLRNKEDEFMRAGNLLLGLSLEALVDAPTTPAPDAPPAQPFAVAIPGQKFSITATVTNRSSVHLEEIAVGLIVRGHLEVSSTPIQTTSLGYGEQLKQPFDVMAQEDAEYTRPYWSRANSYRDNLYHIDQPQFVNLPWAPPEITATVSYRVAGVRFTLSEPGRTVVSDPLAGEEKRLLMIAPAMSVELLPRQGVIPAGRRNSTIDVHANVTSNAKGIADAKVHLELPPGWIATPAEVSLHFDHEGEVQNADFKLTAPQAVALKSYSVHAVAQFEGKDYREGYQVVASARPGLEARHFYTVATSQFKGVDIKASPQQKIGFIQGVGDIVPEALEQLGMKAQTLGSADLASGNLAQFDTIFVGIRASAVREDYKTYNHRLLEYVNNGGNLVVEYQTEEFDNIAYGPYPLHMGRGSERVSEEDAKVTILDPANPLLTTPNRITSADFDGWVEERGSKFLSKWDPQYKPLLESNDRGQKPQQGGMLEAHYGKGAFTFISYALYRQLPAGVPGAYRILANLASQSGKGK